MSRPDFMSKQVIFIESNKKNKLRFRNSNLLLVDENNKILLQHSCHKIFLIFVYGEFSITSILIKKLKKFSISTIFLGYNLKPYFSILPKNRGNFLLRKKQYNNSIDFEIAKHLVENKINNQLSLMKSMRYKTKKEKKNIKNAENNLLQVVNAKNSQDLLGIEGIGSKIFFETYFKNIEFNGRKPRCKSDIFNLLLDIGYYYLFNFIEANLELYGFDTYCGVYHKFFFQRKSLVCDIIEPFRCIIDKRVKKMYSLKQVDENDFGFQNAQFYLKPEFNKKYSRIFLKEILAHKEEIFLFVQSYYRAFMRDKKISEYPKFNLIPDPIINKEGGETNVDSSL
ncbi:MAG: type V CRISPR-associated endonuclease Cas1 [Candidatus Iainarchaeum sp.]